MPAPVPASAPSLDDQVRSLLSAGDVRAATTLALRELGPEVLGFLCGVVGENDGDEVFAALSERLWKSLATFEGRCSIRTWTYVLARHEIGRFKRGARKHEAGRVPISQFQEVLEEARSKSRSALATSKRQELGRLRAELPEEDRAILILRIDRKLAWTDIALTFAEAPEQVSEETLRREAARLRKRFQLVKQRLINKAQAVLAG